MSDALPLPAHPQLEHYKKRAKELVKIFKSGDRDALRAWVADWIETLGKHHGLDVTLPRDTNRADTPAEIGDLIERTLDRLTKHLSETGQRSRGGTLARAQFALAREHGFASWPTFARHVQRLGTHSLVSAFEAAADAIVNGNAATFEKLLAENPKLVKARSTRGHRSTLLHYVSANGVEDFRQKTPTNIVEITKLLLNAGACIHAESDAYGGRSTVLGLTATSCHPEAAGVQLALMELLIEHGAVIDGPGEGNAVNSCLHNGRGKAAEFLAARGARLDLEGAAGVGRLDVVQSFFLDDGSLKPPATAAQLKAGFVWACAFGRMSVVEFLLGKGIEAGARLDQEGGETGLHRAAVEANAAIVRLLLERGAPVDVKDHRHDGTPLDWALYAWGNSADRAERRGYYEVIALLVRAGATVAPRWLEEDAERSAATQRMPSDERLLAALRGQMPPGA